VNSTEDLINVEVAFALPHKQKLVSLKVRPGTTALQAVSLSNIANEFPGEDISESPMGIFGQALGSKGLAAPAEYVLGPPGGDLPPAAGGPQGSAQAARRKIPSGARLRIPFWIWTQVQ